MYARAARVYKRVDLESASKPQILVRLYDRLLRDLDDAKTAIERRDPRAKAEALNHAGLILTEFKAALDHDKAPELCGNLSALYMFVEDQMIAANVSMTTEPLDGASAVVRNLRDAFSEAATQGG